MSGEKRAAVLEEMHQGHPGKRELFSRGVDEGLEDLSRGNQE